MRSSRRPGTARQGPLGPAARLNAGVEHHIRRNEGALSNRIEILYCTQCRWLLRAAWIAQELLTTFDQEISELTLKPGTGGIFEVRANGALVWSRKAQGRFPEITELKQLVRDHIAPGRNLGHADREKEDKG